jgi:predicted RNase H-like nuclease (RuvC/YqgF family)
MTGTGQTLMKKFESLSEELKHLRAENERLRNRQTLLEWVTAAYDETARLRAELQQYHDAVKYPGTDQRHIGTSVATQLVHAQMMREKAENELERLKQNLFMSESGATLIDG